MKTIFKGLVGSHAYGTSTPASDFDYKGVYIQSVKDLTTFNYKPQIEHSKDYTSYEVRRFLELLQTANPTMLEMLFLPKEDTLASGQFKLIREHRHKFLTKKCLNSFGGYAVAQIKKARGLDKKMNWESDRIERKDVLDFCYVIPGREESVPFKHWESKKHKQRLEGYGPETIYHPTWIEYKPGFKPVDEIIDRTNIGLSAVNNVPDLYSMYFMKVGGGIISDNSDDVQLRSIPKGAPFISYLSFNKEGYSQHCKDYREYQNWLKNRNTQRYVDVKNHGQAIDGKNMLHCRRLLDVATEIAKEGAFSVKRPNADYLLSIRRGEVNLEELLNKAEEDLKDLNDLYEKSSLPDTCDGEFVNDLLWQVRDSLYLGFIN